MEDMNYCPECGNGIDSEASICNNCGESLISESDTVTANQNESVSSPMEVSSSSGSRDANTTGSQPTSSETIPEPPDIYYNATIALFGTYILLMIVAISGYTWAGILGVLCVIGSIITMALDISKIDKRIWDTSVVIWVLGMILVWIITMPIYIFKRYTEV